MHINYLILAHSNYKTLDTLIEELDSQNVNFYVHIDKKSKYLYKNEKTNVYILKKRYKVNWGRFNMVKATLELLQNALSKDSNPNTRYVLISGADYPIRPNYFIEEILKKDWEYINIAPAPLVHKPMSRFQYYHFEFDKRNKNSIKIWLLYLLQKALLILNLKRKIPFKIYVGSQWFALTKKCVEYIMKQVNENPKYIDFFKYSHVPDEAFFQTIIGNSDFLKKTKDTITYTDWSTNPAPARITEKHLNILKSKVVFNGDYGNYTPLFARKLDDNNIYLAELINKSLRKKLPKNENK